MTEIQVQKKTGGTPKYQHYSAFVRDICAKCPHFKLWSKGSKTLVCTKKDAQFVKQIPNKKVDRDFAGFDFCPCKIRL